MWFWDGIGQTICRQNFDYYYFYNCTDYCDTARALYIVKIEV